MSSKIANYTLVAAGGALYVIGAKAFADYHENVALGRHDSFQHRHATAIGSVATLGGLGLAVFGAYRLNKKVGMAAGLGLGAVLAYNVVKHAKGEPLISLSPFAPKIGPHRVGMDFREEREEARHLEHRGWGEHGGDRAWGGPRWDDHGGDRAWERHPHFGEHFHHEHWR